MNNIDKAFDKWYIKKHGLELLPKDLWFVHTPELQSEYEGGKRAWKQSRIETLKEVRKQEFMITYIDTELKKEG